MNNAAATLSDRFSAWYAHESQTTNYDIFTRLPALLFFGLVMTMEIVQINKAITNASGLEEIARLAKIASLSATFAVTAIFAALTVLRSKPVARSAGLMPRLVALFAVCFLFLTIPLVTRPESVLGWDVLSALLSTIGGVLTAMVVLRLGRSFSTMPEARKLVRTGAYAYIRHPLYLAEELVMVGLFLQYRTLPVFLILVAQFGLQIMRMNYEEKVLREAFPEYDEYAKETARIIPGVY